MMRTGAQRLARVLRGLVIAVFLCNLIALFLVPGLVFSEGDLTVTGYSVLQGLAVQLRMLALCWSWTIWLVMWAEHAHLVGAALFLLFCGVCTAVLLWQGKRVLDTICSGIPFHPENGVRMRRAALCCFLIAAAALGRTCWGLWTLGSIRPLVTYNTLFCPVFLLAGLFCLVQSALFRQAAELKSENDLII